jgi:hypothetical protein
MNPILEKALKSLSATCNKSALHPNDEDRIKVTLRTLSKNGVIVDANAIAKWLQANSWQEKPVKNIFFWATTISSGGRVQLKNKIIAPTEKEIWEKLNS